MTRGFQVTYWQSGRSRQPKPGERVVVYECQKCALRFDTAEEITIESEVYRWCPCCKSPDIAFWKTVLVGENMKPLPAVSNVSDVENMVLIDLFFDGELDGGIAI